MANQQRNRRRYQDYEESREPRQSRYYSDYEGNPFSDEDEYDNPQYSDYGRGGPYSNEMNTQRQRRMGSDYDMNYRGQGYSSSSQSNRGQYDRSRDYGANQGSYGYNMPQSGSEYRDEYDWDMGQGQYRGQGMGQNQGQYGRGQYRGQGMGQGMGQGQGQYGQSQYRGQGMGQYSDYQSGSESQGSHRGKGFKGWKRSDDSIYDEIGQILEMHPEIDPSEVEIKVRNGEVTLEGTVPDRMTKRRIEDALDMISGVTDVQNRVRVQSTSSKGMQDGERQSQSQSQSGQSGQSSQRTQKSTSTTSRSSEN